MAVPRWEMKGSMIGACSCDWGCPCTFDARPTNGWCQGGYTWNIESGRVGDVSLDGVRMGWYAQSPGPLHEGNVEGVVIVDGTTEQLEAIRALWAEGGGSPWSILASVHSSLEFRTAPIEFVDAGIRSTARVGGGSLYEVGLSRIKNPVTGAEEEIYVDKPTGFTSLRAEVGATTVLRLQTNGLSYEHSGKYGEYATFSYKGP
jgi:hypothetical protein